MLFILTLVLQDVVHIAHSASAQPVHTQPVHTLPVHTQPAKIQTSGSIDLGISDHHLIFAVFKVARHNPKPLVISTKKYKQVDKKQLKTDFEHAPWHLVSLFDDIDDCHFVWNYLYKDIMDHHLPPWKAKIRPNSLPWIDSSIRKEMNKRFKLLNEAKTSGDPVKWSQYREKRNEVKNLGIGYSSSYELS